jgi:fumarylacetoacetate (FAA) hydrolase family protein
MVPEPELALVLGEGGEPVAVTIGNDVLTNTVCRVIATVPG